MMLAFFRKVGIFTAGYIVGGVVTAFFVALTMAGVRVL